MIPVIPSLILVIVLMLMGGVGLALSLYVPHKENFTSEHAVGTGVLGLVWLIGCFVISMLLLHGLGLVN